jgi:putative ABC transport system substrate-binding protein
MSSRPRKQPPPAAASHAPAAPESVPATPGRLERSFFAGIIGCGWANFIITMKRPHFLALLAGAAVWPRAARPQQLRPVIGFLGAATASEWADLVAAFNRGLAEAGFTDGKNCTVEYRWPDGQYDRMPNLAFDLVRHQVDVIFAAGGTRSIQSARTATRRIPIVFVTGADPVELGFVASLARPAGNLTGIMFPDYVHGARRMELIRQWLPAVQTVAVLFNPSNPITPRGLAEIRKAAPRVNLAFDIHYAANDRDIDSVFAMLAARQVPGLVVHADPFLLTARERIAGLAARHRIPTVYGMREFAEAGGIVSYGSDIGDIYRAAGVYTGRILKGEAPHDMPVQVVTAGELVVNRGRAKALGIDIPAAILKQASRVIE